MSVLIIAQSAQLRSSLQVLLTAIPRIGEVTQADTLATARRVHPTHPPTLVVWEVPPCNREAQDARPQIKALWPQSQCLLLVDDEQGQRAAEPAGTETVLVKGTLAAKFLATVETLLTPRQTDAPTPAEESV